MSIENLSNNLFNLSDHFTLSASDEDGEGANLVDIDEDSPPGQVLKTAFEENQEVLRQIIPLTKDKGGQEEQLKEALGRISKSSFKALECIVFLFQMGGDPMYVNSQELNFLHTAAYKGQSAMIERFLMCTPQAEYQILIEARDKRGRTPLINACISGDVPSMKSLLERGVNFRKENKAGDNFLHIAVHQNQLAVITSFLSSIPNSDAEALLGRRNKRGNTPFLMSCFFGNVDAVRLLLENRANPLQKNKNGGNCLHIVSTKGESGVMEELLKTLPAHERRILVNERTSLWGNTPLFSSSYNGAKECAQLLLSAGADPFIFNQEGDFPYEIALERGHRSTADLIADREPKVVGTLSLKRLGSTFGLDVEALFAGKKLSFSGSQSWVEFGYVLQSLQDLSVQKRFFPRCSQRQYKELADAFSIAASESLDCRQIAKRIRSGGLTIFPTGWDEHAIALVFKDDHMVICNRGEGCIKTREGIWQTFLPFKISSEKITEQLLQQCVEQDGSQVADAAVFFYEELPRKLEGRQDPLCKKIEEIAPKPLYTGVCATASAKGSLRLGLAFLTNDFDYAKNASKSWSTRQRETVLDVFKKTSSPYGEVFLEETAAQQEKRLAVRKQSHLRRHLNRLKESISDNVSIKKAMDNFSCFCGQRQRRGIEKSLLTLCKKVKSKLSSTFLARKLFLDSTTKRSLKLRAIDDFIDKIPLLDN